MPTKITRPLATGAVGVAEGEVRGLRAEDVLTDFSRSVVQPGRLIGGRSQVVQTFRSRNFASTSPA